MKTVVAVFFMLLPSLRAAESYLAYFYPEDRTAAHNGYTVAYDPARKCPKWVCWKIPKSVKAADREGMAFKPDPLVQASVSSSSYTGSGYDRGHMCPAADMSHDTNALAATFYTSNVAPQHPGLNRADWKLLEYALRCEGQHAAIVCVAGPLWLPGNTNFVGAAKVAVPDAFWKVAYGGTGETVRAWVFPNRATVRPLSEYRIPVMALGELTGFRFNHPIVNPAYIWDDMDLFTNSVMIEKGDEADAVVPAKE